MPGAVAVTGAGGFVGRHVAGRLAADGWRVAGLVRRPGRRLPDGVAAVEGALEDAGSLVRLVRGADAVVHCAGLVKAASRAAFDRVNAAGVARLAEAAAAHAAGPRFVLVSSLAARRPELSDYAASKREGERALTQRGAGLRWWVLRPPAVYGPGDAAALGWFRACAHGVAPVPAVRGARFSLIYVEDLAAAVSALLAADADGGATFEVRDGCAAGYGWRTVADAAARSLGRRVVRLPVPRPAMRLAAAANAARCRLSGRAPLLSPGKVRELLHPDWVCRDNPLIRVAAWRPAVALAEGMDRTVAWYRGEGWLAPARGVH